MMVRGRDPAAVPLSGGAGVGRNAAVQRGWRGRVAVVRRVRARDHAVRIVQIQIGRWRDVVVRVLVLGLHRQRRDVVRAPPVVRVRLLGLDPEMLRQGRGGVAALLLAADHLRLRDGPVRR